jgi:hypothetical protein
MTREDDHILAQRLRAVCRSVGDQVHSGELTEERLAYALRQVKAVADSLDPPVKPVSEASEGENVVPLRPAAPPAPRLGIDPMQAFSNDLRLETLQPFDWRPDGGRGGAG